MPIFDKRYFEGKGSNYKSYECMKADIRKNYFPRVVKYFALNKTSKVLDIGCAFGYFLKCCDDVGCDTYGIDISEYAIGRAEKETKAKLYIHDMNNIMPLPDNFFDVVTIFDVIEHLESPYRTLKDIYRILKIKGLVIIATPNLNAIYKIVKNKEWQGFKDESHLYLFYPDSLKFLVERTGFEVEMIETPFHPLPIIAQNFINRTNRGGQIWLVARK